MQPISPKEPAPLLRRVTQSLLRHRLWTAGIGAALLLLAAWGIILASVAGSGGDIQAKAKTIATLADNGHVTNLAKPQEYSQLRQSLQDLHTEVKAARSRLLLAKPLAFVPGAGAKVKEANSFLALADPALQAAINTMNGYLPVMQALNASAGTTDYGMLRDALAQEKPLFEDAYVEIQQVKALRGSLHGNGLGRDEVKALDMLDTYLPALELAVLAGRDSPDAVAAGVNIRDVVGTVKTTLHDPTQLLFNTQTSRDQFTTLHLRASDVVTGLSRLKATYGGQDTTVQEAIDIGIQGATLLSNLGDAMVSFTQVTDNLMKAGPLTPEGAAVLKQGLPALATALNGAQASLDQLRAKLQQDAQTSSPAAASVLSTVLLGIDQSSLQTSLLGRASQAVATLQYLLGLDGPRTYLFIGQNQDEIRATGGFLGVVAEMHIQGGELKSLKYLNSDFVDAQGFTFNPIAPEPIFRYLWISRLLFRDSNWNPHFPAAAAQVADLYAKGQGVTADGVIAGTEDLALNLVDAVGGVTVPQIDGTIDSATANHYIQGDLPYPCPPDRSGIRGKRCFDEALFQAMLGKLMQPLSEDQNRAVLQVLLKGLTRKDLLISVFDPTAGDIFWQQNWNGALQQVDYDYLNVVDSSLPGHVRSYIQRAIQYQVRLSTTDDIQSTLLLSYTHTSKTPDPTCQQTLTVEGGCFWDYVRVYVPVESTNVQAPPIPAPGGSEWLKWGYQPADTLSVISAPRAGTERLTEIGGYVMVEPQTTVTLPMSYHLPSKMLSKLGDNTYEYRLLIQRQPGIPNEPVNVFVQLPAGATLISASPAPAAQQAQWVKLTVTLDADKNVVVQFRTA